MSDDSYVFNDSVPGTPDEYESGSADSGSDCDSDDFQTPFNKTTKVTQSRKSLTNKVEESIQETEEEDENGEEELTEDEDEVDRQVKTKKQNLQESYQIPVSSKARKATEESYLSEDQSVEQSESVEEEEEEGEEDSPLQLSCSQIESLTTASRKPKSVVHFDTDEEQSDGKQKSTLRKRIKTPGRNKCVPSSEENSEVESFMSENSSPVQLSKSKVKCKKPPVESEENSEVESVQSEDSSPVQPSKSKVKGKISPAVNEKNSEVESAQSEDSFPVKPSKSKIKSKKPTVESSEEEQESFQVTRSIQRSNKRQPKALVSSDDEEEYPQQAQTFKKRESHAKVTPRPESRGQDTSSSESCSKAVTPDSDEDADCFEATMPNSSPIVQHAGRPKTPLFDISIKDSEAEESYHVKRSIELNSSGDMDEGAEETEQSYNLLKASKQLKKKLISKVKTEAEDSPLKPTGKRTGKMVIRSSEENSAATSEAEENASMESSVDSARSPSPDDSFTNSNNKKKSSRKALQTSSSDGMESSFDETPTSTKGARPTRNIESDDTEEERGFNPQSTPATLVKQSKNIDSDGTEDKSSGYNGRHQDQSSSQASQTLHHMLKTSMERQDSGNDSGMEQLSLKQQEELSSAISAQKNTSSTKIDLIKPKTATRNIQEITLSDSPMNYRQKVETVEDSSDSIQEVSDDSFEENPASLLEKTRARSPVPPPAVIPKARQDLAPKQEMEMGAKPLRVTEAEIAKVREELKSTNLIIRSSRLSDLPDGGNKLTSKSRMLKKQLEEMEAIFASQPPELAKPAYGQAFPTCSEEELRSQLRKKKWALDSAVGEEKDRLKTEVRNMESQLLKMSIDEATGSGSTAGYDKKVIKILPDLGMSGAEAEMRKRINAERPPQQPGGIKYLAQPEKLTEIQKRMLADQPGKDIYQRTASGHITAASKREATSVTHETIENIYRSLASCPEEHEIEETPSQINIPLMLHQQRALKWLIWRETQNPPGGILADDMGLGKTLTMISLILRQRELDPPPPAHHDLWLSKTVKIKRSDGTLIVCPASVVGQWENEIQRRCKRNALSVASFHGADRHKMSSTLHKYGVVITTFQTLAREVMPPKDKDADSMPIGDFDPDDDRDQFRKSILTQIAFNRIILDEAHVIRNPKSGVSQSVCRLRANRRWAVTGTPVQNKELDMYSLLRFLRARPFDDLGIWKRFVDSSKNKASEQAMERLKLLVKALLLRRTKDQKVEGSSTPLVQMPARELHTHKVLLSEDERKVYAKLQDYARTKLKAYLKQQEQKLREEFMHGRMLDEPSHKQDKVTKMQVLTLLLRLRQVCCHPTLLHTMLDKNDTEMDAENVEDDGDEDQDSIDLIGKLAKIKIDGPADEEEDDEEEDKKFFSVANSIFDAEKPSSKMMYIMEEVRKVVAQKHKAVVVSQWTSYLTVFNQHFYRLGIRTHKIDGSVPLKMRTQIVEDFNTNPRGPPVMLLSLGAGGVGLNLIGGNHLFLADLHWNPQLEAQACDRIYRVGQKKDVHVHRMITEGTVEERILVLQEQKLSLANGILTGTATKAVKTLTIDDLKMLFYPQPMKSVHSGAVSGYSGGAAAAPGWKLDID